MTEQELVKRFGVMNFQKIDKIQNKLKNNSPLLKSESEYIVYAFNKMHENFVGMLSNFGREQSKVHTIYEYMKKMNLDFDHNVLEECSEDLHLDIIEEFDNFEIIEEDEDAVSPSNDAIHDYVLLNQEGLDPIIIYLYNSWIRKNEILNQLVDHWNKQNDQCNRENRK